MSTTEKVPDDGLSSPARRVKVQSSTPPRRSQTLQLLLLACLAAALRLYLFSVPGLSERLGQRLELNDPFTSWKALRKTAWSAYPPKHVSIGESPFLGSEETLSAASLSQSDASGTARPLPPPLLLEVLKPFLTSQDGIDSAPILYTALDVMSILLVFRIASLRLRSPVSAATSTRRKMPLRLSARHLLQSLGVVGMRASPNPLVVAAVYAFNPLCILTCLAKSGTTLSTTVILSSLWAAMEGFPLLASASIVTAGFISLHPLLLLPAIVQLCARQIRYWRNHKGRRIGRRKRDTSSDWLRPLAWAAAAMVGLGYLSAATISRERTPAGQPLDDWKTLFKVYQNFLLLPTLTPSLSLWWYFFIEIFDHFRDFFLLVFNVHLLAWVVPICLRFRHDPLFATFLLLGVQAVFKPYPTAGDVGVWMSLGFIFSDYTSYLRHPLLTTLLYLYSSLLVPCFSHLFLVLGSANANFLYAVSLVWSLAGIVAWLDWAWAGGRAWWEVEREAGLREGSAEEEAEVEAEDDEEVEEEEQALGTGTGTEAEAEVEVDLATAGAGVRRRSSRAHAAADLEGWKRTVVQA